MNTRRYFLRAACFSLFAQPLFFNAANGQETYLQNPSDKRLTSEVLAKTLYARTAEQEDFLKKCIALRDHGELPDRLLYAAYRYALKKQKSKRYDYFETALGKLCKEKDITLE